MGAMEGRRAGARYDEIAAFYEGCVPDTRVDPPDDALLDLVGNVEGVRLLDLACGHGRFTREFARRGAQVVGIDISSALLDIARTAEERQSFGITYVDGDAASPAVLAGETFDVVVCGFGLSDIDDLSGALQTVARVLRFGGSFVFSILHPCFPGWGKDVSGSWSAGGGYYQEGWWLSQAASSTLRQKVGANHRMLSTYLNALIARGLAIDEVVEPPFPEQWAADVPEGGPVPVFLTVRCRMS
jgi:2-polyprenyl-3-methyl-5-hydroxy-6-metoxy-1,4-benzoquinol methylase